MIAWLALAALGADCVVISGTTAATSTGLQKGVSVVMHDGAIAAVGRGLQGLKLQLGRESEVTGATWAGESCAFVQGGGTITTAGLVAVDSQLGLVEVGMESGSRDSDAGGDPVRASVRIVDGYNPRSSLLAVQRAGGLTSVITRPVGGWVSGQAAHVRLAGRTQAEAVVNPSVQMVAALSGPSTAGALARLGDLLDDVRDYQRNPSAYDQGRTRPYTEGVTKADLLALLPVIEGDLPLTLDADRASDLEAVIRFKEAQGVAVVIHGAAEGWVVAGELAAAEIPVVVDPLVYGPGSFDQVHGRPENAALLAEAGVVVMFAAGTHNARNLRQRAGNAVRGGMRRSAALAAMTEAPAAVFGLDAGRLQAGASGDVVVWSGDPLELSSAPVAMFIGGRRVSLENRQTALRDAYRTLPGTPRPVLTLP
jgi:imidazolonepropionase-like amidohydrolase